MADAPTWAVRGVTMRRRAILATAGLLAAPGLRAQPGWPERPLRIVVSGSAGGTSDIFVRLLENRLREKLGQPLWIDPRPGAGGSVAGEIVARATDNHTFYVNHIASHGIGPTLHRGRLSFDPLRDIPGIVRLCGVPNVLIVKADTPARDAMGLARLMRAEPQRAFFSSAGAGTSSHLSGVLFAQRLGVEAAHVPYRGTAPAMAAVLNGQVLFAIDNAPVSRAQVLSGALRALGISTAGRSAMMPEIPTLMEQGVPDFDVTSWYGLAGPATLPPAIAARLAEECTAAMQDPAIAARFRDAGADPWPAGPVDYNAFMRAEVSKWADVLRHSGATAD